MFNGAPPYSAEEVTKNGIAVNVNYLEATRLGHDARSQYFGAFLKPDNYFKSTTDMGAASKRASYGTIVTNAIQKQMKRSLPYFETMRSKFASLVLHGISPCSWDNPDTWCPDMIGVGDVLLPARTYLTLKNLPFLVFCRSYTVPEMARLTRGPNVDPAWNLPLVQSLMKWIDKETRALMGTAYPEIWSMEKLQERIKGDGGFYTADNVPTINTFDVYCWDDSEDTTGWERRIILDTFTSPVSGGAQIEEDSKMKDFKGKFLYNPGRRKFASALNEVSSFQFADLSAFSPFQYHSVRSLGFLLYAVCHIQNRLRCKFTEAIFENMMMLLRCKSLEDAERALKVNLVNRGFIDESFSFVTQAERHQINTGLVQLGLEENSRLINENAQSYRAQQLDDGNTRKTKAQVMAELNATTALVQAGLMQAYQYQAGEYAEIFRRFMRPNSRDPQVREARKDILRQRVPEKVMVPEAWTHEPVKVMGAGNKALELEIAQQLLGARQLFDPDAQRMILRDWTLAITDDPARSVSYVPDEANKVTDSVHDAQLAAGSMLAGIMMGLKQGVNHAEYATTLVQIMAQQVQRITQRGGVATPDELLGLQNLAGQTIAGQPLPGNGVTAHVQVLAQDQEAAQQVKQIMDPLGKLMNEVKAFAQRLQEQQQNAQQNGNGQMDPKDAAKIQAIQVTAQVKAKNQSEAQAQRAAQRQLQFQREQEQKSQEHAQQMKQQEQQHALEMGRVEREHVQNLRHQHAEKSHDLAAERVALKQRPPPSSEE